MDSLLDEIYEAALLPRNWPNVLARLAERFHARGGLLFADSQGHARWLGSGAAAEAMPDFIDQGWMEHNERAQRLKTGRHTGFMTDLDLFSVREVETLPVYKEFLGPRGLSVGVGAVISGLEDDAYLLSLEGFSDHDAARQTLGELNVLLPHLSRASMISGRLQADRAMAAVAVLEAIGSPSAVVDHRGALLTANPLFGPEIPARFLNGRSGLRLVDELADHRLQHTLKSVRQGLGGGSIPIREASGQGRLLHVLPVTHQAGDVFLAASAILILTDRSNRVAPNHILLEQLFDLSPAEARIAQALVNGETLRQIADRSQTSIHTVRNQSKAVLDKTGVAGQTQLIKLLVDLAKPVRSSVRLGI